MSKSLLIFLIHLALCCVISIQVQATTVTITAEGEYTDARFLLTLYADIYADEEGPLASAGVKITYDQSKLHNLPLATKNEAVWYLGTETNKLSYFPPDISMDGKVVLLLGKLDINNGLQGVTGNHVLLGTIQFQRIMGSNAPQSFNQACGIENYINFATVSGYSLDTKVTFQADQFQDKSDGIDDSWEMTYFQNTSSATSTSDYDNDGYTDLQEYFYYLRNEKDRNDDIFDPTFVNAPGGSGNEINSNNILFLVLPAILNGTNAKL